MKFRSLQVMLGMLCLAACSAILPGCSKPGHKPDAQNKLRILCGSSMSAPMQELCRQFNTEQNAQTEMDMGGSETLLPKILAGARADIFVCHDPFEEKLKTAGVWTNTAVVGYLEPVLAVRPGNPKNLRSLRDLTQPGLKIGIGDPRYSTCGELFVGALKKEGLLDGVMTNVTLQARSHGEVANGLVLGPLDAVVVWNFVVGLYPGKLEVVPVGASYPETRVTIVSLTSSENPKLRDAFVEWCTRAEVQDCFRKHGYGREVKQ